MIEALPDHVWSVTQDIESWPTWTPTVTNVTRCDDGPFEVGCVTKIMQPGIPECEWRVTELTIGKGFTWETHVYGILISATHEVVAHDSGTKSLLRLNVKGVLCTLLWPIIRLSAKRNLEIENSALKARCEVSN